MNMDRYEDKVLGKLGATGSANLSSGASKLPALVDRLNQIFEKLHTARNRVENLRGVLYGQYPVSASESLEVEPSGHFTALENRMHHAVADIEAIIETVGELEARIIG